MIYSYKGHYSYSDSIIRDWDSTDIGVYYCGYINTNDKLTILYIGKGTGEDGIRGRLLDHLRSDVWPNITHFGYHICDTKLEATEWEKKEIEKYKPSYNTQGK